MAQTKLPKSEARSRKETLFFYRMERQQDTIDSIFVVGRAADRFIESKRRPKYSINGGIVKDFSS